MPRTVRCGLIQTRNVLPPDRELPAIKKAMIDRHVTLIGEGGAEEGRRSSACRSSSTARTSAPSRRRGGTT